MTSKQDSDGFRFPVGKINKHQCLLGTKIDQQHGKKIAPLVKQGRDPIAENRFEKFKSMRKMLTSAKIT